MDKTLVITGGSSGIGLATAMLFAQKGWRVFELSRHGESHDGIVHIDCDVVEPESVRGGIAKVLAQSSAIDVLISNAGFGISGAVEFTALEDAKRQMDVNFFGALNTVQAVLPHMRERKEGRILFTSSVAAVLPVPYQAFYSASKAAINAMALALANEVREFNIRVGYLMPGDVATGFTAARDKSEKGSDVYANINKAVSAMEKDEQNGMRPEQMARIYYKMATLRNPAPYYVGGLSYRIFCLLNRLLPTRFVNWIEGTMY